MLMLSQESLMTKPGSAEMIHLHNTPWGYSWGWAGERIIPAVSLRIPPSPPHVYMIIIINQIKSICFYLNCCVVEHESSVLDWTISDKVDEEIVVGRGDGVRSETGVSTVSTNHSGVLSVSIPDLQVVVHTVPAALNIKISELQLDQLTRLSWYSVLALSVLGIVCWVIRRPIK